MKKNLASELRRTPKIAETMVKNALASLIVSNIAPESETGASRSNKNDELPSGRISEMCSKACVKFMKT